MRIFARLFLLAAFMIPAGAFAQDSGSQSKATAGDPPAQATVYFYRYRQFVGSAQRSGLNGEDDGSFHVVRPVDDVTQHRQDGFSSARSRYEHPTLN